MGKPLAMLDDDEQLLALSAAATAAGMTLPMTPAGAALPVRRFCFQRPICPPLRRRSRRCWRR
ncbi:MAG: hypothetical protein R2911_39180 [Caldilineaceae bacterium]